MKTFLRLPTIACAVAALTTALIACFILVSPSPKSGTIRSGKYWVEEGNLFFEILGDTNGIPVRVPTNGERFSSTKLPGGLRKIFVSFNVFSFSTPGDVERIQVPSEDDFRMVDLLGKNEYVIIRVPVKKNDPDAKTFDVSYSVSTEFAKRFSTWDGTITIAKGIEIKE